MPDYRDSFYEKYVSQFKLDHRQETSRRIFDWYAVKYLPLLAGLSPDDRILDLGCGHGVVMRFLAMRGFKRVEGIDVSAEQIKIAVEHGLNASLADAFEFLESRVETYSAILAIDFVEHFEKAELMRLLPLMYRALKPGGALIVQTPNGEGLLPHNVVYGDLTHLTIFTPRSLQQLLTLTGFVQARFFETGPVANSVTGAIRVILWGGVKLLANAVRLIEAGKRQSIWTENLICLCLKPAAMGGEPAAATSTA